MSTVAIHHPRDPKRPTVIPADRFDESVHRKWIEPGEATVTPLPDDLPGRSVLVSAGIRTMEMLAEIPNLDEIPGIGQKTEADILAYLGAPDGD